LLDARREAGARGRTAGRGQGQEQGQKHGSFLVKPKSHIRWRLLPRRGSARIVVVCCGPRGAGMDACTRPQLPCPRSLTPVLVASAAPPGTFLQAYLSQASVAYQREIVRLRAALGAAAGPDAGDRQPGGGGPVQLPPLAR
jgi:hypothetical protein